MSFDKIFFIGVAFVFSILILIASFGISFDRTTSSEEILMRRWADALGGSEAATRLESLYVKGNVLYGGLNGSFEQWSSSGGSFRSSIIVPDLINHSIVFDLTSGEGWRLDANQQLQPLQGQTLKETITGLYFDSFWHYAMAASTQAKVKMISETEESTIILLTPQGGSDVVVYLDSKTYLPKKSESSNQGQTWTTVYSDWRQSEGLWWPYQQTILVGSNTVVLTSQIEVIEANVDLENDFFQLSESSHNSKIVFVDKTKSVEVPLRIVDNHLFLQVRVNESKPVWFLLDSGANKTFLDFQEVARQGFNTQGSFTVRGFGEGAADASSIGAISLTLPGLSLHDIKAVAIQRLTNLWVGVLGSDLFSQLKVTLDYENMTLSIFDNEYNDPSSDYNRLPLTIDNNLAYLDAEIVLEGKTVEGKFLIDTGAPFSLMLNTPFIQSHDLFSHAAKITSTSVFGRGVGGQVESRIGRANGVRFGNIEFASPIIYFSQDQKGVAASAEFAGVIGAEFLRRLTLTLDYENQTIDLKTNGHFDEPFYYDQGGMVIETAFRVGRVLKGSPAEKAGIKSGDLILSVDQQPVYNLTLDDFYLRYAASENTHAIEIMQGSDRKTFYINLQPFI